MADAAAPDNDVAAAKREARAEARARRAAAHAASPQAGETVAQRLAEALPWPPRVVSGYLPFRSEIDPLPAMRRVAAAGAALCLPVTMGAAPLRFRLWAEGDAMDQDAYGLPVPAADRAATPDVVLAPLLAFDRRGARLGYGGGHYDRTLAQLRTAGPVVAIGVAFAAQEAAALPLEPTDQPLDMVITEREAIRCG